MTENKCKMCPVCNGRACKNMIPGPGSKGIGDVAIRNYDKWHDIRLNMDTLVHIEDVDTSIKLFGHRFDMPIFAGPVGAVQMHYNDKYDDISYNDVMVKTCSNKGILAFTGDGMDDKVIIDGCKAIKAAGGMGIPTIKPWNMEKIREKLAMVKESGAVAVAMDVDAAGLPFLKGHIPPAGGKSLEEMGEIIKEADLPFIVKGVMTASGALKAVQAGAYGIIVSNHGGRVLDQCPATCEVLEEIVEAASGKAKVFVDGGLRHGVDILKALALGADAVLIARPFASAIYKDNAKGIEDLIDRLGSELKDAMEMCGVAKLEDISRGIIRK